MPLAMERVRDDDVMTCIRSSHPSNSLQIQTDGGTGSCTFSAEKSRKSLRNRPSINYRQFDDSSDEDSGFELLEHVVRPTNSPKKGVVRGCVECANCQKVLARWRPEDARRPALDEAPVFYPNEEEFKDTLKYIESIRSKAEQYGICRIVPPPSWKPPCPLKKKTVWENSKFVTRIQRVDLLQNRHSIRKRSSCHASMRKRQRFSTTGSEPGNNNGNSINTNNAENFGFEPGPDFTLESFQKYAGYFKEQYFCAKEGASGCDQVHPQGEWEPTEENIEGEYWRIVEKSTEEIEVLYGADLETGDFGSGFPKETTASSHSLEDEYLKSGWNLNNFPRLTGSVLAFESEDISGVVVPWLYIGMCFSSFCWHVEDHHFYSLNYMHWGAPKMWYGVPGRDAPQLEAAMRKHLPDLFEEQPDLLHKLVTQFSPFILKTEGVPVYRCVQHSGEFVLTFPRAYHSGFNCGFNCAEAVNVAPIDWLPHGQNAVELYRDQSRKISVSHDKLLLGAAREAVKAQWDILFLQKTTSESLLWKNVCGQDKILGKTLKARVEFERIRREYFSSLQSRKMDASFDAKGDKECFLCHYDLHLSAAGCPCSPDKFACLNHANQICSCDWSMRFFLFRYEISELKILIDALGGKLSAVHKWGISDLGLSLRAYVTKQKSQVQESASETYSEVKQQERLDEGLSSNLSSSDEQSRIGKQQTAVSGNESCKASGTVHEKGTECQNFQLPKGCSRSVLGSLSAGHQLSKEEVLYTTPQRSPFKELYLGEKSMTMAANTSVSSDTTKRFLSSESHHAICLEEHKESLQKLPDKMKDLTGKDLEIFARVAGYDDKVTPCDHKDQALAVRETTAAAMSESDADLLKVVVETGRLGSHSKVNDEGHCQIFRENTSVSHGTSFCMRNSYNISITKTVAKSAPELLASKQANDYENCNSGNKASHTSDLLGIVKATDAYKEGKFESDTFGVRADKLQSSTGNQCCSPITVDRNSLQKGPRMAKVVRRITCTVEALEFGAVLSGKLWSTSQAIFPKGYKSRVKYLNVLDPAQMCYYVSEILDGGVHGPLFMVKVEQCPSEVFIHVSPAKCWDMVRERVNHEIRRLRSLGKITVPTLQPPGSIDGLEMFGLSSPAIIQVIEEIDHIHISSEYWNSRPQNKKPPILSGDQVKEELDTQDTSVLPGSYTLLHGLLNKANFEELQLLRRLLTNDRLSSNHEITQVLNKAIDRCLKSNVPDRT